MAAVTKFNNKYILEPDPVLAARAQGAEDITNLNKEISPEELRNLIVRILLRLEALEKR